MAPLWLASRKSKSMAREFAELLESGNGNHMPVLKQIRDFLLTTNVRSGTISRSTGKAAADPREIFIRCVKAWNYWRAGQFEKTIKYSIGEEVPEVHS